MASSLSNLVDNLPEDIHKIKCKDHDLLLEYDMFSNNDINKLILLLIKGVYPYEYMDEWEKFKKRRIL